MTSNFWREIVVSVVWCFLLVALFNPFGLWMPGAVEVMLLVGSLTVFGLFASFLWKESEADERGILHRMMADRIAFLVGTGILMVAIVFESARHMLDRWLIVVLAGMILAKVAGRVYGQIKH